MAEVFRSITDGIWNEAKDSDKNGNGSSIIRRNLQREHVKRLTSLVLGRRPPVSLSSFDDLFAMSIKPPPPDARSLARMHLKDVAAKIESRLKPPNNGLDDTTRAHLEECQERIAKVLNASMQVSEP